MTKQPSKSEIAGPEGWGTGLSFSPDGRLLAVGGNNVQLYEWPSLNPAGTRPGGRWPHFTQSGDLFSATSKQTDDRAGDSVRVVGFSNGKTCSLNMNGDIVRCISFSANSNRLVTVAHKETTVWELPSSKPLWHSEQAAIAADVSPTLATVAIAGFGVLRLHNLDTGDLLQQSDQLPEKNFCCVRLSRSAGRLATAAWDGTIQIWNSKDLSLEQQVAGHPNFVNSLEFSPDGKRLASASTGGSVRLWNTDTGDLMSCFHGSLGITGNPARGLAFSPDGTALLSATSEGLVKIWHAVTPQQVARQLLR